MADKAERIPWIGADIRQQAVEARQPAVLGLTFSDLR
jgi:hypothetical protein